MMVFGTLKQTAQWCFSTYTNSKTGIEKVDIYSINGKLVKSFDFNGKYTVAIPMSKLSSGMYFLNINKDKSNTHKFIVE